MTESDIIARVRERLDEDASVSMRYPPATLSEYITDGVRFYVARTGCQVATTTITQTANELIYYLPCDLIQVQRVLWNGSDGKDYSLEPTTARDLDGAFYRWQRDTDTRARMYFLLGLDRIALWPISSDGGETYTVHYRQDVYDAVSRVPVEDHECLVDYAVARCLLSAGETDGAQEYKRYREVVEAANRRKASVDRVWSMGRQLA